MPDRHTIGRAAALGLALGTATVPSLAAGRGPVHFERARHGEPVATRKVDMGRRLLHLLSRGKIETSARFRTVRLDLAYSFDLAPRWLLALGLSTRLVTPRPPASLHERGVGGQVSLGLRF